MSKARILLETIPRKYSDCPFSDDCGWACSLPTAENGECACLSGNSRFNFKKCPYCKAIYK